MSSVNYLLINYEISKNIFITEHLWTTASSWSKMAHHPEILKD